MIPHRIILALVSIVPLSLACQSAYAANGGPSPQPVIAELLPPAKSPIELVVEERSRPTLTRALEQLAAATGVHFTASDHVRNALDSVSCGVLTSVTVPPTEAWIWVESLLLNEGFTLGLLSSAPPHLVAVYTLQQRGGESGLKSVLHVPVPNIEALAEHPALLVTTALDMPHTDVRQLGNSLRGLTTDPTGQQSVVPVGNTNTVILTGTGRQVLQLVTMLREVDAASAAAAAAQAHRDQEAKPAEASGTTTPR